MTSEFTCWGCRLPGGGSPVCSFRARLRALGHVEGQDLKVDAILTYGTPAATAARKATATIPIVFAAVSDPLGAGLVASLLKEALPAVSRVAVLVNPDFKVTASMIEGTIRAARALGVETRVFEARAPREIARAFAEMRTTGMQAAAVLPDPMFIAHRREIVEIAAGRRIPVMYHLRQFVVVGGLMSYGADYDDTFEQCRWSRCGGLRWR